MQKSCFGLLVVHWISTSHHHIGHSCGCVSKWQEACFTYLSEWDFCLCINSVCWLLDDGWWPMCCCSLCKSRAVGPASFWHICNRGVFSLDEQKWLIFLMSNWIWSVPIVTAIIFICLLGLSSSRKEGDVFLLKVVTLMILSWKTWSGVFCLIWCLNCL